MKKKKGKTTLIYLGLNLCLSNVKMFPFNMLLSICIMCYHMTISSNFPAICPLLFSCINVQCCAVMQLMDLF